MLAAVEFFVLSCWIDLRVYEFCYSTWHFFKHDQIIYSRHIYALGVFQGKRYFSLVAYCGMIVGYCVRTFSAMACLHVNEAYLRNNNTIVVTT